MAITIRGSGTITGISAGGLPNGSVTAATLATSAKPVFSSYALLTDQKDGGTNGGSISQNTWTKRTLNLTGIDTDNIVTLNNSEFTLGVGTYFIKFIVPNYRSTSANSQLYDVNASAPVQTGVVNMSGYGGTTSGTTGLGLSHAPNWARIIISSGTRSYYIRNYIDSNLGGTASGGVDAPDDNADSSYYTTVEIYKEAE